MRVKQKTKEGKIVTFVMSCVWRIEAILNHRIVLGNVDCVFKVDCYEREIYGHAVYCG